ncbi:hypothetical protein ACJW8B_15555 [Plesiomonas shigelloides]|uniref:hypothetical protein n=1 Tax=Plesiomonas shigelloides TaxID=703 RepID=UPI00387F2F2B
MPKLSVAAEPADWKENRIAFAYTADSSTLPLTYNAQDWKEYDIYINDKVAKTTHSFDAAAKSKKKYN